MEIDGRQSVTARLAASHGAPRPVGDHSKEDDDMTLDDLKDLAQLANANGQPIIAAMSSQAAGIEWDSSEMCESLATFIASHRRSEAAKWCESHAAAYLPLWRAQEAADVIGVPV